MPNYMFSLYKTLKNTLVRIFIKIGPVNQKLPEGS